ncbi:hypothetical protein K438DRAFT_1959637 [Mycena galopus ATCC 62051]|nr:hypothetical protein K438DRAFT_1959637 [Mycena galopus ATCC 62051]
MSLLLLAVFLLPIFAQECIDSANPCSTSRSPIKVVATLSALLVLLVGPFLVCALIRRMRQHASAAPPDVTPLRLAPRIRIVRVPPPYMPPSLPGSSHEVDFKAPQVPPPSYSST